MVVFTARAAGHRPWQSPQDPGGYASWAGPWAASAFTASTAAAATTATATAGGTNSSGLSSSRELHSPVTCLSVHIYAPLIPAPRGQCVSSARTKQSPRGAAAGLWASPRPVPVAVGKTATSLPEAEPPSSPGYIPSASWTCQPTSRHLPGAPFSGWTRLGYTKSTRKGGGPHARGAGLCL